MTAREVPLSPMVNIIIGDNGVGKRELMRRLRDSAPVGAAMFVEPHVPSSLRPIEVGEGTRLLLWELPETGLCPTRLGDVVEQLLDLARERTQVVITTYSYVLLKEMDLRAKEGEAAFHTLYVDANGGTKCESAQSMLDLTRNPISDALMSLYNRDVRRSLGIEDLET